MPIKRDMSTFFNQVNDAVRDSFKKTERKNFAVEHLFFPTYKDGKTTVIMRFLPPNVNEYKCFVENRTHIAKGFGIDCLMKFGKLCPICEHNHAIYLTYPEKSDQHRDELLLPKSNQTFFSNVYIVRNDNAPETEGKIYRYRYGKQIMSIIKQAMNGYDDAEEGHVDGFSPFDWMTGANFTLIGEQGPMGPRYEKSKFGKQRPICKYSRSEGKFVELTEEEQNEIERNLYTLDDIEKKESDCKSAEKFEDYVQQKFGRGLWKIVDGKAVPPTTVHTTQPVQTEKTVSTNDFRVDFGNNSPEPPATEETSSSNDESSFFDELEKM